MSHIRLRLLAGAAAVALASSQANAADMGGRQFAPPPPVPYFAPVYTWTGFYVGGNVGWGWGDGSGDIGISGLGSGPISGDGNGFIGGAQLGYNWQFGAFLFGLETDFQGSSAKTDVNGRAGPARINAELENPWFGTVRGRLGYASDRWLAYVTGGGVYGKSNLSGSVNAPGHGDFDANETFWSWTLGGGVEYSLWDRWSTKFEYLYVGTPSDNPVPPQTTGLSGDTHAHLLRTGLNYRF